MKKELGKYQKKWAHEDVRIKKHVDKKKSDRLKTAAVLVNREKAQKKKEQQVLKQAKIKKRKEQQAVKKEKSLELKNDSQEEEKKSSGLLKFIFILIVLCALAYLVWRFLM